MVFMHELLVAMHVMLPVERSLAYRTNPFRFLLVHRTLMSQQIGAQAERKAALVTTVRTFAFMHSADVSL